MVAGVNFQHINQCKFVERRSGERKPCSCAVSHKRHRRGYPSVSCTVGHTWVWCKYCCSCTGETNRNGCVNSTHWFERDSYDTGSRNHMQRHRVAEEEPSKKRSRVEDPEENRVKFLEFQNDLHSTAVKDGTVGRIAENMLGGAKINGAIESNSFGFATSTSKFSLDTESQFGSAVDYDEQDHNLHLTEFSTPFQGPFVPNSFDQARQILLLAYGADIFSGSVRIQPSVNAQTLSTKFLGLAPTHSSPSYFGFDAFGELAAKKAAAPFREARTLSEDAAELDSVGHAAFALVTLRAAAAAAPMGSHTVSAPRELA